MNEMIERIQRAIVAAGPNPENQARSIIAVMRVPTPEMVAAGKAKGSAVRKWQAMVDVALHGETAAPPHQVIAGGSAVACGCQIVVCRCGWVGRNYDWENHL